MKKEFVKFYNAFTLLEVLIATSVFAIVMLMTTGVIAQSAGYQSKIKAVREASNESSRISEMLSKDLRAATGTLKIYDYYSGTTSTSIDGIIMLNCRSGCMPITSNTGISGAKSNYSDYQDMNGVVILSRNNAGEKILKFYVSSPVDAGPGASYSYLQRSADILVSSLETDWYDADGLHLVNAAGTSIFSGETLGLTSITSDKLESFVGFSGFTPTAVTSTGQGYIDYFIVARTANFDNLKPAERAESIIRSMVTARSYSQSR